VFHFRSITSRITFLHIVAIAVTAGVLLVVHYIFMNAAVTTIHNRAIFEQTEWLARHLEYRPDGELVLNLPAGLRDLFSESYGRYTYAVLDDTGKVLFSSSKDLVPVFSGYDKSQSMEFLETRRGNLEIEGASIEKTINGRNLRVQLGENLAHRDVLLDDLIAEFLKEVGWTTIPIMLFLLIADILIVRHAMQPLLRLSAKAREISPVRINVRLPIDNIPKEIFPLVTAVNQALDRLESGFHRQREFTGDVAHELRTPLAVLRTRLETFPDQKSVAALHRDVEIMSRVVSQLLDSAEMETLVVDPDERADLHQVATDVAEFVAPLALAQKKAINLNGTKHPVWVNGNAETLRRAIRNLAENAIRHAPPGTAVEIFVGSDGTVSVLDRGEGIDPAKREAIFERFVSGDNRRTGGAGLGLSIVKKIVETHGGSITVKNRTSGGAEFKLHFTALPVQGADAMAGAAG
jgi:signal transduction histidine kinase